MISYKKGPAILLSWLFSFLVLNTTNNQPLSKKIKVDEEKASCF